MPPQKYNINFGLRLFNVWFFPILLALFSFFNACNRYPDAVQSALEQAGPNRKELVKVLTYYAQDPADSLKLRAAEFLIGNMPGQVSYWGKGLTFEGNGRNSLAVFVQKLGKLHGHDVHVIRDIYRDLDIDKVRRMLTLRSDLTFLKASYLINNIDQALDAWHAYPWSKDVSFKEFCNYILPYNVLNEPPENWRREIRKQFHGVKDSLKNPESLMEATRYINNHLPHRMGFIWKMLDVPAALGFHELRKLPVGKCAHKVIYQAYVLRAMGIPVRVDYVPFWANHRLGHSWLSVRDSAGRHAAAFDAMGEIRRPYGTVPHIGTQASKIFRQTYETHYLINDTVSQANTPPLFNGHHSIDVTRAYLVPTRDLSVRASPGYKAMNGYLAVFNGNRWEVTAHGTRDRNGRYKFHNVGVDAVYLPVNYHQYRVSGISNPLLITKQKKIRLLDPNQQQTRPVRIDRKYPIQPYLKKALKKMIGGVFQGANKRDFSDAQTLYRIQDMPRPKTNHYDFYNTGPYRYLRFKLPYGQCRVAELRFTQARQGQRKSVLLQGKLISSPYADGKPPANTADGNVLSYFVARAAPDASTAWASIPLTTETAWKRATGTIFFIGTTAGKPAGRAAGPPASSLSLQAPRPMPCLSCET